MNFDNSNEKFEYNVAFVETPLEIVKLMIDLISKNKKSKILDPGCGKGNFIKQLRENGYENITGVELNKKFSNYCRKTYPNASIINKDFLKIEKTNKYDVIIGNPPYSHYNSLPSEIRKEVTKITGTKETDIYHAFIIQAIELLAEGGELIFIVPYGFFYNTFAKKVRKKINDNGYLETIIDLDEVRIFQNKMPETIIFKFTKTRFSEKKSTILNLKNRNALLSNIYSKAKLSLEKQKENDLFMYHKKILDSNSNSIWSTYPDINLKEYSKLDDVACVAVGMVSGFDKAFRIDQENIEEFTDEQVDKIIFPFVKGKHCMGFYVEGHSNYILLDDQVKNETDFREKYPNVYKKFLSYKESMGNRYLPSNKKWYQWQALRNYETFKEAIEAPKIFVPTLDRSKTNRFSLSTKRVYPSGDVLTIIPQKIDPFFLLGYLNSSFFRSYYLANGARRGHRLVYTQRLVSDAKIPLFPNEIKEKISALAETIFNTTDQSLRNEIDELIASYFARKKE